MATPSSVADHFGTSAAIVAVASKATDLLARWCEFEGADGLVYEAVDPAELLIRVGSAIQSRERGHVIRAGRVRVDLLRHFARIGDFSAELTSGEALILGCLASTSGAWWQATGLVDQLRAVHQTSDSIWQFVHRLRAKLGAWRTVIETSRTRGYRLNPCAKPATDLLST